jgi:hypothetical protein
VAHTYLGNAHIGAWDYVSAAVSQLRGAVRAPALVGAALGFALAVRARSSLAAVPGAILVLVLITYAGFVVIGLAVPDRMLLAPAVMLALFCGFAIFGWRDRHGHIERRIWAAAGIAIFAGIVATAPHQVSRLEELAGRVAGQQRVLADLGALNSSAPTRPLLAACGQVSIGSREMVGFVAYYLDRPLGKIGVASVTTPTRGAYLAPAGTREASLLVGRSDPQQATAVPPGFQHAAGNRSWNLYTRGC